MQFSYDGNGKLNYIHKLKNGSQWADPATLEHNERDRAALQGFKRKQAFDRFSEDAFQRLKYVELDKELLAEYIYNGIGQRIIKKTKDTHTHYYYENNLLAGEWTTRKGKRAEHGPNGGIDRRYIYAGQLPVTFIEYERASLSIDDPLNDSFMDYDADTFNPIKKPQLRPYKAKLYFIHSDHIGQPFMVTDSHACLPTR
ncbi:hypothetical protein [Advenella alkanexedens]|uniref:hypothetical protein n=1 Tax=Advenella alkanexedens TaxID=1481665 RepID=UPI00267497AE|nr:hypothetical protein [Advenella alkanexedens]WKU19578.1 hypothetical protein Q3V95_00600 [Advenella alkanexedens]